LLAVLIEEEALAAVVVDHSDFLGIPTPLATEEPRPMQWCNSGGAAPA
jgi:hypothetical protein